MGAPLDTPAGDDQFLYLTESGQCAKVLSSIILLKMNLFSQLQDQFLFHICFTLLS